MFRTIYGSSPNRFMSSLILRHSLRHSLLNAFITNCFMNDDIDSICSCKNINSFLSYLFNIVQLLFGCNVNATACCCLVQ